MPFAFASNAARTRLPTIAGDSEIARAGALMAYGPSQTALLSRTAVYVDKILRGAKPADSPSSSLPRLTS